ncbi:MAG TPA: GAF domain-containing protein, partial [Candidatus Methylacidiphilales bacterium]
MPAALLPANETQRLDALRMLKLLDTEPEERFDRITRLAARILNVPIAYITLVDEHRQFKKSRYGSDTVETPREISFCAHAILENKQLVIPDAQADFRFADNILVTGKPHIRFYAGNPIAAPDGSLVGTLCVIDRQPRIPSAEDLQALRDLAVIAQSELNLFGLKESYHILQQTEDKLRLSEGRYREVIDIPGRFIWESTLEGKILYLSERYEEVLGYTVAEGLTRGSFASAAAEDAV